MSKQIIEKYGYWVVFLASMIEGESVVITASIFASQGKLILWKVMYLTFLGTLFADQALFFVGRIWGPRLFHRFPQMAKRSVHILEILRKYNVFFILIFRFVWGIRTLSPIVIGLSGVPIRRFMVLNFISAIIWTGICCSVGYFIGDVFRAFSFHNYTYLIALLLVTGSFVWLLHRWIGPRLR